VATRPPETARTGVAPRSFAASTRDSSSPVSTEYTASTVYGNTTYSCPISTPISLFTSNSELSSTPAARSVSLTTPSGESITRAANTFTTSVVNIDITTPANRTVRVAPDARQAAYAYSVPIPTASSVATTANSIVQVNTVVTTDESDRYW